MIKFLKNNSFGDFILKLTVFFVTVFFVDLAVGHVLKTFYYKQQSGFDYQATYAIDKTEADIVILGSSRATNLYDPSIFEAHYKMSCFNGGRYGFPIFYHYALLEAIVKRHPPKMVILSFDAGNFKINQADYDKISSLLPYYDTHSEIRQVIALKGPYEKLKMLSAIYPYNSLLFPIIFGNSSASKKKYSNINGYMPLTKIASGPLKKIDYTIEKNLDSVKINTYKSFIKLCIDSNINLFVVCPPYLINAIGIDPSIVEAKKIAKEYNVQFIDYSRDSFYVSRPELFADFRHLNKAGVELFSKNVIEKLNIPTQSASKKN